MPVKIKHNKAHVLYKALAYDHCNLHTYRSMHTSLENKHQPSKVFIHVRLMWSKYSRMNRLLILVSNACLSLMLYILYNERIRKVVHEMWTDKHVPNETFPVADPGGARDVLPPLGPNSFSFIQLSAKVLQNNRLLFLPRELATPLGNTGSTTGSVIDFFLSFK